MNPKRLIQVFNNHELGLQERLFRLLVTIGLMGLAMGILVGLDRKSTRLNSSHNA